MRQYAEMYRSALPEAFCWSRFGTEAGEPVDRILARKEDERRALGGKFFWGIGSSVAPGIRMLLGRPGHPEVIFSPIRSRPRPVDVSPPGVVRWRACLDLDGNYTALPDDAVVTSRARLGAPRSHYALVCHSEAALELGELGSISFGSLRNLGTGSPLGPSQVTSVVKTLAHSMGVGRAYPISLRARLVAPYFVRLQEPKTSTR